jgi:hypothetical protein
LTGVVWRAERLGVPTWQRHHGWEEYDTRQLTTDRQMCLAEDIESQAVDARALGQEGEASAATVQLCFFMSVGYGRSPHSHGADAQAPVDPSIGLDMAPSLSKDQSLHQGRSRSDIARRGRVA